MVLRFKIVRISLGLLFIFLSTAAFSQKGESNNPYAGLPLKERIFVGGGLGLSFGTITFISVSPIVGYNVSPRLSFGLGPSYQYYRDNRATPDFSTSIYGGSAFGRYFVLENIFLQSEFEVLNLEQIGFDPSTGDFPSRR